MSELYRRQAEEAEREAAVRNTDAGRLEELIRLNTRILEALERRG